MSTAYSTSLAVVIALLIAVRVTVAPARRPVRASLGPGYIAVLVLGAVLLTAHCTSMFAHGLMRPVPGLSQYASAVDRFGPASMVLFSVPALLCVLALRGAHPLVPLTVAGALTAVGVTMYDGGGLAPHLTAIFVAVVVLVSGVLFGVRPGFSHTTRPRAV